jgi:hypothetical protein
MITIKEPYHTAGRTYGWEGSWVGIGLDLKYLRGSLYDYIEVFVESEGKHYRILLKDAITVINKYNAFHTAKNTRLGVIPEWAFERVPEEKEPEKIIRPNQNPQQKLL